MSTEWDGIEGVEGWRAKLESLLREAEALPANANVQTRLKMNRRLTDFQLRSTPNSDDILELDAIAEAARAAVIKAGIDERLEGLAEGSAALARFTKQLRQRAASLEADARSLRFERADKAVQSLTDTIRTVRDLIDTLDAAAEDDLVKKSERLITTLQNFRSEIERPA